MEKYLELKRIIEEFLELRKNLRKRKELKESHSLSLLNYLYAVNCVIYNEGIKMREDIRKEIKDEIRKWSIFSSVGKFDPLGDYMFLFNSSDYWNNEEKMKEFREINTKISKLTSKIREISTEIFRYDIYPF